MSEPSTAPFRSSDADAWLARAQAGDEHALDHLLAAVQPQLYRYSMKMCRQPEDAEDILQESLLAIARSVRTFRGQSSLSTWIFTIARRFCIKRRRQASATASAAALVTLDAGLSDDLPAGDPTPYEQAETAEAWRQVHAALSELDPGAREVLVLRDIEGLSAREVAQVVGASVSAVKSRLHRARGELRERLARQPSRRSATCPDIRLVFSKHLEDELSASMCTTLQAHIEDCPDCAAECDGLKAALNACAAAPLEVPPAVQRRVKRALRQALEGTPSP